MVTCHNKRTGEAVEFGGNVSAKSALASCYVYRTSGRLFSYGTKAEEATLYARLPAARSRITEGEGRYVLGEWETSIPPACPG